MSATARPRGRPRSADADAAIVRATLEVLREEGFRGLSVDAVRQRAGVGKATIYRRFPDKEALVTAAVRFLYADLEPPDTGSFVGDLEQLWAHGYGSDRLSTTFAPRLLAESAANPDMHAIFRAVLIEPRRAVVRTVVHRAVERGELRDDVDVEFVIDLLAGPVIYRLLIDGGDPSVLRERGIDGIHVLLDGLRPRG